MDNSGGKLKLAGDTAQRKLEQSLGRRGRKGAEAGRTVIASSGEAGMEVEVL